MGRGSGKGRVQDYYKKRGQRTHGEGARRRKRKTNKRKKQKDDD